MLMILIIAINNVFEDTVCLWCGWHRALNFKKRFYFLNKGSDEEKKTYSLIVNLPHEKSTKKFEENF